MTLLETNLEAILQEKQDKIIPGNIKKDVQIFDITGTYEGLDTSDADAIPLDIVAPRTAYVNGEKITGSLPLFPNSRTFTVDNAGVINDTENNQLTFSTINALKQALDSNLNMNFSANYSDVAQVIGLTADKIKAGETILGVTGTYIGEASL